MAVFAREVVPLWEAAMFTLGCMVLQRSHMDANRVAVVLTAVVAVLVLTLMIALTPEGIGPDHDALGPGFVWARPGGE